MAHSLPDSKDQHSSTPPPGAEEFAARLFSVVMFGVCGAILLMAIFANW